MNTLFNYPILFYRWTMATLEIWQINILLWFYISGFCGLECFFGMGNTSEKDKQKTTECGGDNMVCKKMFDGGMGDQIRRYCEEVSPDVINIFPFLHFFF